MCADPKAPLPRNMTHLVVRKIGGIILHRMAEVRKMHFSIFWPVCLSVYPFLRCHVSGVSIVV